MKYRERLVDHLPDGGVVSELLVHVERTIAPRLLPRLKDR